MNDRDNNCASVVTVEYDLIERKRTKKRGNKTAIRGHLYIYLADQGKVRLTSHSSCMFVVHFLLFLVSSTTNDYLIIIVREKTNPSNCMVLD